MNVHSVHVDYNVYPVYILHVLTHIPSTEMGWPGWSHSNTLKVRWPWKGFGWDNSRRISTGLVVRM